MLDASVRERGLSVWRRVLALSWPLMVQHVFRTLMRTIDVIVTGLFSPAAVVAVGLATTGATSSRRAFSRSRYGVPGRTRRSRARSTS